MLLLPVLMSVVLMSRTNAWDLGDDFVADYGFKKIMANCFGAELYSSHLQEIQVAEKYCLSQPVYIPEDVKYAQENLKQYIPPSNNYKDPNIHAHAGGAPHTHSAGTVPHIHFPPVDQQRASIQQGYSVYQNNLLKGPGILLRAKNSNAYNSSRSARSSFISYPPVSLKVLPPQQGYPSVGQQGYPPIAQHGHQVYPNTLLKEQNSLNTDQDKQGYAYPQPSVPFNFQQQQQPQPQYANTISLKPRHPVFDAETIMGMVDTVKAKISNFTCTLSRLGMVDSQFGVNIPKIRQETLSVMGVAQTLKQDLISRIDTCYKFSTCLPVESIGTPVPASIQRVMAFFKCERKLRLRACMKEDLRNNLASFDLSGFPIQATEDERVEKLLFVLSNVDSKEFQIA